MLLAGLWDCVTLQGMSALSSVGQDNREIDELAFRKQRAIMDIYDCHNRREQGIQLVA